MAEMVNQKEPSIGMKVSNPKNTVVLNPPPTFHANHVGTPKSKEKRRMFEKLSEPAESAGRGAFLIAGYYKIIFVSLGVHPFAAAAFPPGNQGSATYRSGSYTTFFEFLKCGSGGFRSLDELELGFAPIDAVRFRHDGRRDKTNSCWSKITVLLYVDVVGEREKKKEERKGR